MGAAFGGVKFVSAAACYNVLAVFNVIINTSESLRSLGFPSAMATIIAYGFLQIGVFNRAFNTFCGSEILFDFYNGAKRLFCRTRPLYR